MLEALRFLRSRVSRDSEMPASYLPLGHRLNGCLTAVDGGSCIISDGGSWIIAKIKIASVHYDAGKRVPSVESREEFYYTVISKEKGFDHSFSPNVSMKPEFKNARDVTEIPAIVMRTLEFRHAAKLVCNLPKGSTLLIDGLLSGETEEQTRAIAVLEEESKRCGVNVIGLAKTSRQSLGGRSIIGSLIKGKPNDCWVYKSPSGDNIIVKLHEASRYAYVLSSFKHVNVSEVLPIMAFYSGDPELIGYPYPLLRVDREARISSYERKLEMNKLKILSKKEGFDFVEFDERSTSMHSIMDQAKYR